MKKIVVTCVVLFLAATAINSNVLQAAAYNMTAGISTNYSETDPKSGEETVTKEFMGMFQYMFKPVSLENGPYAEAAFMQKAGYVSGAISLSDYDGPLEDIDMQLYGIECKYVFPVNIALTLYYAYGPGDGSFDFGLDFDVSSHFFGGELGYYIMENAMVSLVYERFTAEYEFSIISADFSTDRYGAAFKMVFPVSGRMSANIETSFFQESSEYDTLFGLDDEKENIFNLAADFYFTPKISAGCELTVNRGDDKVDEGNTYGINSTVFISQYAGITAQYAFFKANDTDEADDEHSVTVEVTSLF